MARDHRKSWTWSRATRQTRPGFKSIQGQVTIIDGFIDQEKILWRCCSICPCHGISKKEACPMNTSYWLWNQEVSWQTLMIMTRLFVLRYQTKTSILCCTDLWLSICCMDRVESWIEGVLVWLMEHVGFSFLINFVIQHGRGMIHILCIGGETMDVEWK